MSGGDGAADTAIVPTSQIVVQPLDPGQPVVANYAELEAWVDEQIGAYESLVVKPDYLKQAKRDRAECNSIDRRIHEAELMVKRACLEPYDAMVARLAPIRAKVKQASANIDKQVKAFDEKEKRDKREAIEEHWLAYAGILAEHTPFEVIFDEKWLNKTPTLERVKEIVEQIVDKAAADEATLSDLDLAFPAEAKSKFLATLDLAVAIQHSKDLEAQRANTAAFEASKAEILGASTLRDEAPCTTAVSDIPGRASTPASPEPSLERSSASASSRPSVPPSPTPRTWTLEVFCSRAELDGLIAVMKARGITGRAVG